MFQAFLLQFQHLSEQIHRVSDKSRFSTETYSMQAQISWIKFYAEF